MTKIYSIILLLVSIFIYSCSKDDDTANDSQTNICEVINSYDDTLFVDSTEVFLITHVSATFVQSSIELCDFHSSTELDINFLQFESGSNCFNIPGKNLTRLDPPECHIYLYPTPNQPWVKSGPTIAVVSFNLDSSNYFVTDLNANGN